MGAPRNELPFCESGLAQLDVSALSAGFSAYVHIPFCSVRCGYCDFNTYTNLDFGAGASAHRFAQTIICEIQHSAQVLRGAPTPALTSVFFGGGTPTLLPAGNIVAILDALRSTFGIQAGADITVEANPESVSAKSLAELQAGGVNRISFGMQSACEHVLSTLDRHHTPGQVQAVTAMARELNLEYSLDLIYGTPGESLDEWKASLAAAIALSPGHISAYALTVEPHTPMGRRIERAEITEPDPDDQADKYIIADELLSAAGYQWYEISNWALPGHESRHNLNYWREGHWWGYGPGAHSHIAGRRWWNVKHPIAYARALGQFPVGGSGDDPGCESALPIDDGEQLTVEQIREEHIMLGIRLREGIAQPAGTPARVVAELVADGLLEPEQAVAGRLVLTLRGRLLADVVTRALWA
ncbi:MAG: radical SAM family heme chaperone HemW [Actinomycetaceae bacterium]|nr:radical SAM family heme chaperone HemW [Actinomycetaceae bacterium]MDY5854959.1 radical SAM family heme chaperone HemW [Arcanobacterium sp.]